MIKSNKNIIFFQLSKIKIAIFLFVLFTLSSTVWMQEKKKIDFSYNQQMSLGGNILLSTFQTVLAIKEISYSYHPIPVQVAFNLPLIN